MFLAGRASCRSAALRFARVALWIVAGIAIWPAASLAAGEYYVGEPVEQNGLRITPNYFTDVREDPARVGRHGARIHLEAAIQPTKDRAHASPPDFGVPNLLIRYRLTKGGASFVRQGTLKVGNTRNALYSIAVRMDGEGTYHLTFVVSPAGRHGAASRADSATGAPPSWRPFELTWIFTYPSKPV